jgi:predicted ATPase
VNGRNITIPWQARGIAKFSFNELCGHEYFSADYIAIASTYHTVIITDIPKLNLEQRDRIRRFIILIDELYNHNTKLIFSLSVDTVKDIFNPLKDNPHLKREDLLTMDEFHSIDRTISRLMEMQSKEYLAKPKRFSNQKKSLDEWSQLQ